MPHATNNNMSSSSPMTNGETSSKFISHAASYPVVNDGIETFKSHPVGKKSIEIADGAYQKFGKPVEGYLQTPYGYVKPYVEKADEMADAGLGKVDAHFPIVKEETGTIVETAKDWAFWPYRYVTSTWSDEYKKTANHNNRGSGLTTSAMALVSTELKIASDFFQTIADFLGPKYEESKKKGADYVRQAEDTAQQYKQIGQEKMEELSQQGQEKTEQAKGEAKKTADQAKGAKEDAKGQAQGAKEEAQKKAGQK